MIFLLCLLFVLVFTIMRRILISVFLWFGFGINDPDRNGFAILMALGSDEYN